ncbi:FixH family protein [Pseudenhygromyxa sp. WMMC2535]|uniref:FixH family protein n=1 Tax=Pseudenhygromyxa sp. WMMC2535 TaxID=2712867 RepID=UPI001554DDD0|nr:FixH family protein [Pseudenhygromyxa sp. WMMC2535]NVB42313.1 FixH family protein [Pseudenhygromyxa sp. WMMC2535]
MNRLAAAALAFALATPLAACTESETDEFRDLVEFQDGMGFDSDLGAFRLVLSSDSGELTTGRNDLVLHVGFHDPNDPQAEGRGIPNATVLLDAWMPGADTSMQSEVEVSYLGDGAYALDNVVLTEEGVWNIDLDIAVGEGMYETASLAFRVSTIGSGSDADEDEPGGHHHH